jgi:hypothetical protein
MGNLSSSEARIHDCAQEGAACWSACGRELVVGAIVGAALIGEAEINKIEET